MKCAAEQDARVSCFSSAARTKRVFEQERIRTVSRLVGRISNKDDFPESSLFISEKQRKRSAASVLQSVQGPTTDPSTDLLSKIESFYSLYPKAKIYPLGVWCVLKVLNSSILVGPESPLLTAPGPTKGSIKPQIQLIGEQNGRTNLCGWQIIILTIRESAALVVV